MKKYYLPPEVELIRLTLSAVITESIPEMENDELTPLPFDAAP